jgi:hypothetical protein
VGRSQRRPTGRWRRVGERRPAGSPDDGGSAAVTWMLEESRAAGSGSGSWAPGVAYLRTALVDRQT